MRRNPRQLNITGNGVTCSPTTKTGGTGNTLTAGGGINGTNGTTTSAATRSSGIASTGAGLVNNLIKSMSPSNMLSASPLHTPKAAPRNRTSSISLPGTESSSPSDSVVQNNNNCNNSCSTPPGSPGLGSGPYWRSRLNTLKNSFLGTPRFHRRKMQGQHLYIQCPPSSSLTDSNWRDQTHQLPTHPLSSFSLSLSLTLTKRSSEFALPFSLHSATLPLSFFLFFFLSISSRPARLCFHFINRPHALTLLCRSMYQPEVPLFVFAPEIRPTTSPSTHPWLIDSSLSLFLLLSPSSP